MYIFPSGHCFVSYPSLPHTSPTVRARRTSSSVAPSAPGASVCQSSRQGPTSARGVCAASSELVNARAINAPERFLAARLPLPPASSAARALYLLSARRL